MKLENEPESSAHKEKIESICRVGFVVDTAGVPFDVKVVLSSRGGLPKRFRDKADYLDAKAIEGVSHYRFYPALYKGKPVQASGTIEVVFRVN